MRRPSSLTPPLHRRFSWTPTNRDHVPCLCFPKTLKSVDVIWNMGKTGYNTKCYSSHDQPTLAVWRHWTILKEDDGGGPRLPHGKSVPPHERKCKLDLVEPDPTLTYFHIHRIWLSSLGEPIQTQSRGRRCLSWRKDQRRWKFPIGEWEKDNKISSKLWYSLQQNI